MMEKFLLPATSIYVYLFLNANLKAEMGTQRNLIVAMTAYASRRGEHFLKL